MKPQRHSAVLIGRVPNVTLLRMLYGPIHSKDDFFFLAYAMGEQFEMNRPPSWILGLWHSGSGEADCACLSGLF